MDTIVSPKRNIATLIQPGKLIIRGKKPEQAAAPKITNHPSLEESKHAIELHFEKGTPSLKITVLDNEQSQARKMIKPRREVRAEEWVVN